MISNVDFIAHILHTRTLLSLDTTDTQPLTKPDNGTENPRAR